MSRTRATLAAAVLATTALAVPAALAGGHACTKPGAQQLHDVHEAGELVPVAGAVVSEVAHEAEEAYCAI